MTVDAMRRVLDLVSEGRLSIEEAGPILDALDAAEPEKAERPAMDPSTPDAPARAVRIEVSERGRSVVNLRVPIALGRAAVERIPGLSEIGRGADPGGAQQWIQGIHRRDR